MRSRTVYNLLRVFLYLPIAAYSLSGHSDASLLAAGNVPDAKTMQAELDMFSGRPNPSWTLTAQEITELLRRLRGLPETASGEIPERLGYRGIRLSGADAILGVSEISIGDGVVLMHDLSGGKRRLTDPGRALERWLLDTASGRVDEALRG